MNPAMVSLAYKFVAMALMLAEVNFFCSKTALSGHILTERDVREGSHAGPPRTNDFTGSILTDKYFFGFGWGHLANFYKRGFMPTSESGIRQRNLELSKSSSVITTNQALEIATNWLSDLGIDVGKLETKYRRNVFQWRFYPDGQDGAVLVLPVYQIEWRGFILRTQRRETAVVTVAIFGATKELVEYHVLDSSLFLRPRLQIRNMEKLLSMSDDAFRVLTPLQRSNLVAEFSSAK